MGLGRSVVSLLPSILAVAVVLVLWQVLVPFAKIPQVLAPLPSSVLSLLFSSNIPWAEHAVATLSEAVLGFLLAVVIGIPLAVLISMSKVFKAVAEPIVVAAQIVPKVAFVPILVIWLGLGGLPRVLTVFLVCFFPIVIDTTAGLAVAERDMVDTVRSYNPRRLVLLTKVLAPAALPQIFAGFKISITLAPLGAIVAEYVASNVGLGFLILSAESSVNTTLMFAAATVLILIGFMLYGAILVLERLLIPWKEGRVW